MGNINLKQTSFAGIASALGVLYLTGATYDDMQDFINTTISSGRISGGTISDDGDGTITVAAGTGFIKSNAASAIEETYFFDWPQSVIVPLVDGSVNYIYVEYNAGTPRAWSTTTRSNIRLTDQFTLGRVYKDGGTLHIINSGTDLANHIRLNHERLVACRWVEQASGGMVSEPAALKLKTTAGVFYVGSSKITTAGKDTSVADTFDSWYRDGAGGWNNELGETDVNNTKYDDGSGVLADLPGASKYSARYVYIDFDGHIMIQYGQQANAKLSVIQAEEVPAPPAFLNEFAILAARVIIRDGDSPLVEIAGAYVEIFAYQGITRHDDLAGITSDQHHAQIHAAEHEVAGGDLLAFANIPDFGDWLDQAVKQASSPIFPTVKLSALTDAHIPYHVSDAVGLANSGLSIDGDHVGINPKYKIYYFNGTVSANGGTCVIKFESAGGQYRRAVGRIILSGVRGGHGEPEASLIRNYALRLLDTATFPTSSVRETSDDINVLSGLGVFSPFQVTAPNDYAEMTYTNGHAIRNIAVSVIIEMSGELTTITPTVTFT